MKELLIPIAKMSSGHYISIDNAEDNETYYCPGCHSPLVIKNGEIYRRHFSHPSRSKCRVAHGGESLYHLVAKDIICESGFVVYNGYRPKISISNGGYSNLFLNESMRKLKLINAKQEQKIHGTNRIADIAFQTKFGEQAYIEVVYGHPIDSVKSRYYQDNQINCIQVTIPKNTDFTYEGLRDYILSGSGNKVFSGDWARVWCDLYFSEFKRNVLDLHAQNDLDNSELKKMYKYEIESLKAEKFGLEYQINKLKDQYWDIIQIVCHRVNPYEQHKEQHQGSVYDMP